jgi:hypothetical protein
VIGGGDEGCVALTQGLLGFGGGAPEEDSIKPKAKVASCALLLLVFIQPVLITPLLAELLDFQLTSKSKETISLTDKFFVELSNHYRQNGETRW